MEARDPQATRRNAGMAIVALIVTVVIAVATCRGEAPEATESTDAASRVAVHGEPRHAPRARRTDDVALASSVASRDAAVPMPDVEGFPAIDVEVRHATGDAAPNFTVYAVSAGGPGRWDATAGPHATTDTNGRCRLAVARSGSFDVGAVRGPHHALARDVLVPRREPLVIELPPLGEVVFVATARAAESPGPKRPTTLCLATAAFGRPGSVPVPGRDETLQWAGDAEIPPGAHEVRLELPTNLDLTNEGVDGLSADPARFRAPALIHVDRRPCYYAQINVRIEPSSAIAQSDGWLAVQVDAGPGGDEIGRRVVARIRAGASVASQVQASHMVIRVGGPDGTIRWSGRGVADGTAEFAGLEPHVPRAMEIVARLDGAPLPAEDPRSGLPPPTRFRVLDPLARTETVRCVAASGPGGGPAQNRLPGEVVEASLYGEVWIAATRGDEVAGPVLAKPGRDAPAEITLVPGGYVTVSADTAPPAGLGPLTVGLRDGGMLSVGGDLLRRVDVPRPRIIGPMPPGTYALVVRIGDAEVRTAVVTIRAHETTDLRIPPLAPR